jgi:hypothetical protein
MIDDTDFDSVAGALTASRIADLTRLITLGTEMAERCDRINPAAAAELRKEVDACRRAREALGRLRSSPARRPSVRVRPGTTIH